MRGGRALCGWIAVAALLATHARVVGPPAADGGEPGLARRLVGPFAGLAAEIEWIRFQRALLRGDAARALARAETAIALEPARAGGYELLATELALGLGSAEREPDAARRRAWLAAALATLARGEARADDAAQLAFARGYLCLVKAETDPALGRPGGAPALFAEAAEAFARADALGHPDARAAEAYARERIDR